MTLDALGGEGWPIVLGGDRSGHEIEHPMGVMAVVILGGLVTSAILNVFLLPAIDLRYGWSAAAGSDSASRS